MTNRGKFTSDGQSSNLMFECRVWAGVVSYKLIGEWLELVDCRRASGPSALGAPKSTAKRPTWVI